MWNSSTNRRAYTSTAPYAQIPEQISPAPTTPIKPVARSRDDLVLEALQQTVRWQRYNVFMMTLMLAGFIGTIIVVLIQTSELNPTVQDAHSMLLQFNRTGILETIGTVNADFNNFTYAQLLDTTLSAQLTAGYVKDVVISAQSQNLTTTVALLAQESGSFTAAIQAALNALAAELAKN